MGRAGEHLFKAEDACDCRPWNPAHEKNPVCSFDRGSPNECTSPATHMLQHREAGPFMCDHLICAEHKDHPLAVMEHDAVPLHVLYPSFFEAKVSS